MLSIFYCPQKSPESQYFKQMYPVFNCSLQPYIFFQPFQKFDENDSRNARFVVNPRQTNPRWSINLIKEVPPKAVNTRIVACDGGPGALGHPRVYINLVSYFIVVWQCISFLILSKVTYCCPQLSPVNFLSRTSQELTTASIVGSGITRRIAINTIMDCHGRSSNAPLYAIFSPSFAESELFSFTFVGL